MERQNKMSEGIKKAKAYCEKVNPHFDDIREHCDKLEMMVADDLWPLS